METAEKNLCPTWLKFLSESVGDARSIELIRSFMCAHLSHERFGKALYLSGHGGCGKSVLVDVLSALTGEGMTEHFEFKRLGHRFHLARLWRKEASRAVLVVIDDYTSADPTAASAFKSILDGYPIEAEFKYQDPFVFNPLVNVVFNCNSGLRIVPGAPAYSRVAVVRMNRPERPNPLLTSELMSELEEIGRWIFQGVERESDR